jgi:hypothetical protein
MLNVTPLFFGRDQSCRARLPFLLMVDGEHAGVNFSVDLMKRPAHLT